VNFLLTVAVFWSCVRRGAVCPTRILAFGIWGSGILGFCLLFNGLGLPKNALHPSPILVMDKGVNGLG
jgi:hypothetical protein